MRLSLPIEERYGAATYGMPFMPIQLPVRHGPEHVLQSKKLITDCQSEMNCPSKEVVVS